MKIRIRSETNGTYFRHMTPIGPAFGATWKDAYVFESGWNAYEVMKLFPLVVSAEMVNEKRQPCDVQGKPLKATARRGNEKGETQDG